MSAQVITACLLWPTHSDAFRLVEKTVCLKKGDFNHINSENYKLPDLRTVVGWRQTLVPN